MKITVSFDTNTKPSPRWGRHLQLQIEGYEPTIYIVDRDLQKACGNHFDWEANTVHDASRMITFRNDCMSVVDAADILQAGGWPHGYKQYGKCDYKLTAFVTALNRIHFASAVKRAVDSLSLRYPCNDRGYPSHRVVITYDAKTGFRPKPLERPEMGVVQVIGHVPVENDNRKRFLKSLHSFKGMPTEQWKSLMSWMDRTVGIKGNAVYGGREGEISFNICGMFGACILHRNNTWSPHT